MLRSLELKKHLILFLFFLINHNIAIAVHHHERFHSQEFIYKTEFFFKNRLLLLNINQNEEKIIKLDLKKNSCKIENRKLMVFFFDKSLSQYKYVKDNKIKKSLDDIFKSRVILIGYDGKIKYSEDKVNKLSFYLNIIDSMPIRTNEIKEDKKCD